MLKESAVKQFSSDSTPDAVYRGVSIRSIADESQTERPEIGQSEHHKESNIETFRNVMRQMLSKTVKRHHA